MLKIGILFGTDSGSMRSIAKEIALNLITRFNKYRATSAVNINPIEVAPSLSCLTQPPACSTYTAGVLLDMRIDLHGGLLLIRRVGLK
jgi:hypothetical protein